MLSHKKPDSVINVKVEFGESEGKVPLDNIAKRAEAYKPKERVKLIFDLYPSGQSVVGIIKELEKRKILSPTGKE